MAMIRHRKGGAMTRSCRLAGVAFSLCTFSAFAEPVQDNFSSMSLEELGDVRITSVSKREERLADAPAAIFVISADDVRRSGAASLAEVLRLAPNLHVAQSSAGNYVITARGFAANDGNKLLVLIDGRSVYTPLFSGVFWDAQDVPLDDIERIEVVSGPGGTVWGTNAVNGVINVITREAGSTQGGRVAVGGGNRRADATARYGGAFGAQGPDGAEGRYRVYGKTFRVRHTETASGAEIDDAWHKSQAGFRADWQRGADQVTVQGDAYRARKGQPAPGNFVVTGIDFKLGEVAISGVNLMTRWTRQLDGGASVSVQAYYDRVERTVPPTFAQDLDIVDLQAHYTPVPIGRHAWSAGAGYRHASDRLANGDVIAFLPADDKQAWSSLFAQDEITLAETLRLTLGLRVERNSYTGNELLPNARLAWKVTPDDLLWAAASRTVRAPSRLDRDVFIPAKPPFLLGGGPNFESEVARFFELGYRSQVGERVSYSVNLYRALYDKLKTQELAPSRVAVFYGNGMMGATRGIEAWGSFQATPAWRLSAGFAALNEKLWLKPDSIETSNALARKGRDPSHTASLRSSWQLEGASEFDVAVRRVARLSSPDVPAYTAVDMRYARKLRPKLDFSISGANLFGSGHGEFTEIVYRTRHERSVHVNLVGWY